MPAWASHMIMWLNLNSGESIIFNTIGRKRRPAKKKRGGLFFNFSQAFYYHEHAVKVYFSIKVADKFVEGCIHAVTMAMSKRKHWLNWRNSKYYIFSKSWHKNRSTWSWILISPIVCHHGDICHEYLCLLIAMVTVGATPIFYSLRKVQHGLMSACVKGF